MLNFENEEVAAEYAEMKADVAEMEAESAKMMAKNVNTHWMAKKCNEISAEFAEMEAKADKMKMKAVDINELSEMAEKLNVIGAGLILLGYAESGLAFCLDHCDPEDFGEVSHIKHGFDNYEMSIKPFAVKFSEMLIDGLVECMSLDELLDLLDPLVVEMEDMVENGLVGYDEEVAEVIKKSLRNRKRR